VNITMELAEILFEPHVLHQNLKKASCPRRGLSRQEAALYIGVSASMFDDRPWLTETGDARQGAAETVGRITEKVRSSRRHLLRLATGDLAFGLPNALIVWAVVGAGAIFLLNRTTFGRAVYGIGNRERAAYLSGIDTQRIVLAAFAIAGGLSALAAEEVAVWTARRSRRNRLSDRHAASDATGFAHDQIRLQNDTPGSRTGLAGHTLEEQLCSEAAECFGRLVDDSKDGREDCEVLNIVEAHESHVLGDRKAPLAQRLHRPNGGHVVDRKNSRRKPIAREDLLRRAIAANPVDGRSNNQVWLKQDPSDIESVPVSS
jgi:Branched-chain amino acid transport system / permease component